MNSIAENQDSHDFDHKNWGCGLFFICYTGFWLFVNHSESL